MAHYEYQPLDLSTNQIRLIRLLQGYQTAVVECEIFETSLDEAECVPYEALSYRWDHDSKPVEIRLNGNSAEVTQSMHMALSCLRLDGSDRLLWVDTLCINQADDEEKSHQVALMRDIYHSAERVLIWLGRASNNIEHLMDLLTQLERRAMLYSSYRKQSPESWHAVWPVMVEEQGGTGAAIYLRRRAAMVELLQNPWFQRIWVLQETAMARRALVVCGRRSISSRTFAIASSLMGIEPEAHSQAVLEIMPGHLRGISWWSEKPVLKTLLWKFRLHQASNPRDRVYALLGISSDACRRGVFPANYEISHGRMIQNTISYLIFGEMHDTSLHTLPEWDTSHVLSLLEAPDLLEMAVFTWALDNSDDALALRILNLEGLDVNQDGTVHRTPLFILSSRPGHAAVLDHLLTFPKLNLNANVKRFSDWDDGQCNALDLAVKERNLSFVRALLTRQGFCPNTIVPVGFLPITAAASQGDVEMVRLLLDHGVNVDGSHSTGSVTPLWVASAGNHHDVVALLLKRGANVDAKNPLDGSSPLGKASAKGFVRVMTLLLDAGANIEKGQSSEIVTPLCSAVSNGKWNAVEYLLDQGANPLAVRENSETIVHQAARFGLVTLLDNLHRKDVSLDSNGGSGWRPLHVASRHGQAQAILFLLSKGADINCIDDWGRTPLGETTMCGNVAVMKLLLSNGAEADLHGPEAPTPLLDAAWRGDVQAMHLLLGHDAGPNGQDAEGRTALMGIAYTSCSEMNGGLQAVLDMITMLLQTGQNINLVDYSGVTALSWAARGGSPPIIQMLLKKGADPNFQDTDGKTALIYIISLSCGGLNENPQAVLNIIEMLLQAGANINLADASGMTALSWAAQCGHLPVVKMLLEKGADLNIKDNCGHGPEHYLPSQTWEEWPFYTSPRHPTAQDIMTQKQALQELRRLLSEGGQGSVSET